MEHTEDDSYIGVYITEKGYKPKIREGAIVQCLTRNVIPQLMTGYQIFSSCNEAGKMMFTDRHFKSNYNRNKLPEYIYGLVEEVSTDASCENNYYLDIFKVNFYGEHLLKGFGKKCSPKLQMWEYQTKLIRNKTDNTSIDIEGVDGMFLYDYDVHHWIKALCIYCDRT